MRIQRYICTYIFTYIHSEERDTNMYSTHTNENTEIHIHIHILRREGYKHVQYSTLMRI